MTQFSLFEAPPTLPYQPHSETSRAAAESMQLPAVTVRQQVLDAITAAGPWRGYDAHGEPIGGLTDGELISRMPYPDNTVRPRRIELVATGEVKDSGHKRRCPSGRMAVVWVAASEVA